MARQWSETEDAAVREYYPTEGAKGCASTLRTLGYVRTDGAVKERAKNLGVRRDRSKMTRNQEGMWTDEEISILRRHFPKGGASEVVKRLAQDGYERTIGAVTTRANMLGLKVTNTKRRMETAGKAKLVNIVLDTKLDAELIRHLDMQRNRSAYIRGLVEKDIRKSSLQ